jgi:hypothetical protein
MRGDPRIIRSVLGVLMIVGTLTCTVEAPIDRSCSPGSDAAGCGPSPSVGPSPSLGPAPSRDTVFRTWAPANERAGVISGAHALEAAGHFDLLVLSSSIGRERLRAMARVDPQLRLLVYMNAAFAQSKEANTYPRSWYARDASGEKIRSVGFGNWLMDVSEPGWIRERAARCQGFIEAGGFGGCMLDLLGTSPLLPGYATGIPVHEETHEGWLAKDWLRATSRIARTVARAVRPAVVIGNGLGNGARFFDRAAPSSVLLEGVDGGIAEAWLRSPREPLDAAPTTAEWLLDIELLSRAGEDGDAVLVLTKAWADGTELQKDRLHEFALASFLLGMEGNAYFAFSYSPRSDPLRWHPWWDLKIGRAIERFGVVDGVYRRRFSRGLVLVNPADEARSTIVDGDRVDLRGVPVHVADLPAHSGLVLLDDPAV